MGNGGGGRIADRQGNARNLSDTGHETFDDVIVGDIKDFGGEKGAGVENVEDFESVEKGHHFQHL